MQKQLCPRAGLQSAAHVSPPAGHRRHVRCVRIRTSLLMPRWARALLAFLVLPGLVAFTVPALLLWSELTTRTPRTIGLISFIAGVFLLGWCVRDFYVAGKGTLAPWDP